MVRHRLRILVIYLFISCKVCAEGSWILKKNHKGVRVFRFSLLNKGMGRYLFPLKLSEGDPNEFHMFYGKNMRNLEN